MLDHSRAMNQLDRALCANDPQPRLLSGQAYRPSITSSLLGDWVNASIVGPGASLHVGGGKSTFAFVLTGMVSVEYPEGRFDLESGTWLCLPENKNPAIRSRLGSSVGVLTYNEKALLDIGLPTPFLGIGQRASDNEILEAHMRWSAAVLGAGRQQSDVSSMESLENLLGFVSGCQSEQLSLLPACRSRSIGRRIQTLSRLQKAVLHIEGNASRVVDMDDLAKLCNWSRTHFTKAFSSVYGIPPKLYSIHARLRRAALLLRRTSMSINEICAACGYSSPCSFARAFRKYYRITASDYRSNYQSGIG